MTSPSSQFSITLLEIEDQFAFQGLHVADLASNLGEFGAQQVLDFPASMSTAVSQIEKLLDLQQGEPQSLHLSDKSEPGYVISGIEPEATLGSRCSWQQRPALVEADRIYILSFACCAASPIWIVLPGLSGACGIRKSYTLDRTPESSRHLHW